MAHILLVEPDAILAQTYVAALQQVGHIVQVCAGAQSAVLTADTMTQLDAVLLELQLVAHSGIEFLYEFRSYVDWQTVPVIILSQVPAAEFSTNWHTLRQQLGISDYLYKPETSLRQLAAAVDQVLAAAT